MSAPEDTAERFFGTPERVLRRRHLRPGEEDRDVKEGGKNQLPPEDTDVGVRKENKPNLSFKLFGWVLSYVPSECTSERRGFSDLNLSPSPSTS